MCISNIGNRRPFPTNGFQSRGEVDSSSSSTIDTVSLKDSLKAPAPTNSSSKYHHIVVQHCYHDHAHDSREDYQEDQPARGGVTVPFPLKLHEVLTAVMENGHEHIVSWQPHGRCFVVHKPKEFVELLPHYFKLSKLASFQRQLNLYGFQRLTRGQDRGGYYHELFLKDRVFLAHSIQRIKVKGTGVRARSNPDQEPDFWSMPWVQARPKDNSIDSNVRPVSCESSPSPVKVQLSTPTLELPSTFFLQKFPRYLEPTALPPDLTINNSPLLLEDDDVFFGKHFYDVEKIARTQPVTVPASPTFEPTSLFESSMEPSNSLLSEEVDEFFQDFDFPDDIGSEIEDDQVFGAFLEQMIS